MWIGFTSSKVAPPPTFNAVRWRLRRGYAQHALVVRAAVLGVVAAVLLGVFEVQPQWQGLQVLRAQPEQALAAARESAPARDTQALAYVATHARQPIAVPAVLGELTTLAAQQGVRIESVEQAPRALRELPLRVMTLNTTVSGSYPALRAFMAEALRTQPQLGLESWSMSGAQDGTRATRAAVKAELRWVVLTWVGQRPAVAYSAGQPRLNAVDAARDLRDLFSGKSVTAQPAKVAAPLAVAPTLAPSTPALEVIYLGRMALDGAQQAMVEAGGQSLLLKVGDALAGGYRIAAFDDDGLTLTQAGSGEQLRVMRGQGGK